MELVNTGDRQFMRASTRELVDGKYFNKIYYSCKIASGWSEWTSADTPSSLKLSTDLTKEIRFGEDTNGNLGVKVDSGDLTSFANLVLDSIYPVGAICFGTHPTVGTWEKVTDASGKALWGSDNTHLAGTTIDAGLPNITGCQDFTYVNAQWAMGGIFTGSGSGALYRSPATRNAGYIQATDNMLGSLVNFDASRSNAIYGNSTTVQPPAYVVDVWKRIS